MVVLLLVRMCYMFIIIYLLIEKIKTCKIGCSQPTRQKTFPDKVPALTLNRHWVHTVCVCVYGREGGSCLNPLIDN